MFHPPRLTTLAENNSHFSRSLPMQLMDTLNCKPLLEPMQIYPEKLKELSQSIPALPLTQVNVERLFSPLEFIELGLRSSTKNLAGSIWFSKFTNASFSDPE
ncbi:hypothetical protein TNCT_153701 [Trichonephila clavata]|uniref:Uncharacterized protein n=1 Tax=Trichonephila clavata TaxID=2740835 RepID=A0A8X6HM86_TRICU|nr:hypothetical protein TNCT_153701 [Trichonephila clavata]